MTSFPPVNDQRSTGEGHERQPPRRGSRGSQQQLRRRPARHPAATHLLATAIAISSGCASGPRGPENTAETADRSPKDWLFDEQLIDDLPYVETSSATAIEGSSARLFVPQSFRTVTIEEAAPERARVGMEHGTGARLTIELSREIFPGSVASVKRVLALMQVPATEVPQHLSTKMDYLEESTIAAAASVDGVTVDGLAWWDGDWLIFVRVIGKPMKAESRVALRTDLRELLAGLRAANQRPD